MIPFSDDDGCTRKVDGRVLVDNDLGDLLEVFSEADVKQAGNLDDVLFVAVNGLKVKVSQVLTRRPTKDTYMTRQTTNEASNHQRSCSQHGRLDANEFAVEQGDLHQETSNVLCLGVLLVVAHACHPHPGFRSWVTNSPADSLQDMAFHLDECRLVVGLAAHVGELPYGWHTVLCVLEFGSDPKRGTANELVMLLVDYTLGDVTVDNVHGQVQDFRSQSELVVNLDQEVDKERSHVPLKFRLHVHEFGRCQCRSLKEKPGQTG